MSLLHELAGLQVLDVLGVTFTAESGGLSGTALQGVLPALQKLKHLELYDVKADWPAASLACSALIPSTSLTRIDIGGRSLPAVAYKHLLTAGRVLPKLRGLVLQENANWDHAAVMNAVSCCPGLQKLNCSVQLGVSVAPLGQLSSLTGFFLSYRGSIQDGKACMQAVAALTNLQSLQLNWTGDGRLGLDAFVPLTALRQLTHLQCVQKDKHGIPQQMIWITCQVSTCIRGAEERRFASILWVFGQRISHLRNFQAGRGCSIADKDG